MHNKLCDQVLFAAGLAVSISVASVFPATAQYQVDQYGQPLPGAQQYSGQTPYNPAQSQGGQFGQMPAQQGYPASQYPSPGYSGATGNSIYSSGNNSQQFGTGAPPGPNAGYPPYSNQAPSAAGGYAPGGAPSSSPATIYGYASDVNYGPQGGGQPFGQPPVQQPVGPGGYNNAPAPVYGYQPSSANAPGMGLQQSAGAFFDQLDQQQNSSRNNGQNEGGKLGGKLAQGAKTLAGVAVPMATGYFMTQAANRQARRMGLPSGGVFGNPYMNPYGMNPYGVNPYGFGGGVGGANMINGLGSLFGR